ncbi:MAG: FG-GAP repeat protein [Saprospiraceae bacterium]|nr:FG-GAP repeat protein [Saprospiraceae bacterium]
MPQTYIIDLFYKYLDNKLTLIDSIKFKHSVLLPHPNTSRINISENFSIIGFDRDSEYGLDDGSVNIYKRSGENGFFSKITHHNPHAQYNSRFGIGTAISEDERFLVIGAILSKDIRGKVYIYELHGDKYELYQTITEPTNKTAGLYGNSISFKNNILLIGHSETQDNSFRGKVYFYTFIDGHWQLEYTIQPPVGDTKYERFGISVDQDGETFIAGADTDNTYHTISGAAYIFQIPARDTVIASVCKSEGYAFGDTTYYESGTYRDTLIASYGVDSVVVLNLSVLPVYKEKLDTILCEGQSVQIGDQVSIRAGISSSH